MAERCEHWLIWDKNPLMGTCSLVGPNVLGEPIGCHILLSERPGACLHHERARANFAEAAAARVQAELASYRRVVCGWSEQELVKRAQQDLADYRLLVASEGARLRVLLEDPGQYTGQRLILEGVVENLSAPAPAKEEEEL